MHSYVINKELICFSLTVTCLTF